MTRLTDEERARYVAQAARAIGLPISEASLPAVLANARILEDHAARVMDCPLPPETPIAESFRP